jgi:hypothetical protein
MRSGWYPHAAMTIFSLHSVRLCAALPLLAASLAAQSFEVPSFRGLPDTAYAGWDSFTVAIGLPGNLPDLPSATPFTSAVLVQNNPTAFITGGGNIYSFAAPLDFALDFSTAFTAGLVVLQTRTIGNVLAPGSFVLSYLDNGLWAPFGAPSRTNLYSGTFGGAFGGSDEIDRWTWTLPDSLAAADWRITFVAAGSSLSLDALRLDVAAIPEPSTYALLFGLATVALVALRSRRRG